jgi:hypothetical protein
MLRRAYAVLSKLGGQANRIGRQVCLSVKSNDPAGAERYKEASLSYSPKLLTYENRRLGQLDRNQKM